MTRRLYLPPRSRGAGLAALAAVLSVASSAQGAAPGACFSAHGRLYAANGNPTFRIAVAGRVLGVRLPPGQESLEALPPPLPALLAPDAFAVDVIGEFTVCPLTPPRAGRMRMVRLAAVRNLAARKIH